MVIRHLFPTEVVMSPHRMVSPKCALIATLMLAALIIPATVFAQDATAQPPPVEATTTGTPAPTSTPAPTATATPTFTALQNQLVLAQTYLEGKDFARAAALFAAVAEVDRGNAEALAGLKAALDGQAAVAAPTPALAVTPAPLAAAASATETAAGLVWSKLRDYGSTVVAGLLVVVLVYLLANAFRWLLYGARELWLTRVRPWFRYPAVQPGFLIGEFVNGLGADAGTLPSIVAQALVEKLMQWNQLVRAREIPVEPAPALDLGGMGWLKIMWTWILPPARGYKVTGMLMQSSTGAYRLAVQRTVLAQNRVDLSKTLEKRGSSPDTAFHAMASEIAKWLVSPADMASSDAVARGMRALHGDAEVAAALTPSEIFDQSLDLLLPVREQVNQGAVDFNFARKQLADGEQLLTQLPDGSQLRSDLRGVIADLRQSVPAG
jgi:hypothetical protein